MDVERWTIKAERKRFDALELCWRRFFRILWNARRSNQSVLKERSPKYSLEGLMLELRFQYLCHLMWRSNSLEKTLVLGKIEDRRRRGRLRMRGWHHQLYGHELSRLLEFWWTGKPGMLQSMGSQRVEHDWDWTELNWFWSNRIGNGSHGNVQGETEDDRSIFDQL